MNDTVTLPVPSAPAPSAPAPASPAPGSAVTAELDGPADRLLVCRRVEQVTGDMKTFVFEPADPGPFRHDPGQYLAFTFRIDGREVTRCYTISSPPTRPDLVTATVKRVPGGLVSNWLHDRLSPGDVVGARGPLGRFSMVRHPAPAYLFLSGGSGVTPLMSMTRTLYDQAAPADVVFVHSARTPDDIPFRDELQLIAETAPNIRVAHLCEDAGPTGQWHGHRGRLTLDALRQIAPDLHRREVFTCGPPGYMRAVREMLSAAGHPEERYHQESFEAAAPDCAPMPAPDDEPAGAAGAARAETFSVELSRSGRVIECDAGTPVLEAAAKAGITLPSACGEGVCGTCVTTLAKGSVEMADNGGLRPRDKAQHKILLCCATPRENLTIEA